MRREAGEVADEATLLAELGAAGWRNGYAWGNRPGELYADHAHSYDKLLICVSGNVLFRTADGNVALSPGDRLELDRNTPHSAEVGPHGVRCLEGHRL